MPQGFRQMMQDLFELNTPPTEPQWSSEEERYKAGVGGKFAQEVVGERVGGLGGMSFSEKIERGLGQLYRQYAIDLPKYTGKLIQDTYEGAERFGKGVQKARQGEGAVSEEELGWLQEQSVKSLELAALTMAGGGAGTGGGIANIGLGQVDAILEKFVTEGKVSVRGGRKIKEMFHAAPKEMLDELDNIRFDPRHPAGAYLETAFASTQTPKTTFGITKNTELQQNLLKTGMHELVHNWRVKTAVSHPSKKVRKFLTGIVEDDRETLSELNALIKKKGWTKEASELHTRMPEENLAEVIGGALARGEEVSEGKMLRTLAKFRFRDKVKLGQFKAKQWGGTTLKEGGSKEVGILPLLKSKITKVDFKEKQLHKRLEEIKEMLTTGEIIPLQVPRDWIEHMRTIYKRSFKEAEAVGNLKDQKRAIELLKGLDKNFIIAEGEVISFGSKNILREGGSKTPWAFSQLERVMNQGPLSEAKTMKAGSLRNQLQKGGVSKAEWEWVQLDELIGKDPNKSIDMADVRSWIKERKIEVEVEKLQFLPGSPEVTEEMRAAITPPKHASHMKPLPAGEDFTETMVKLKHEGEPFTGSHHDPDTVVAALHDTKITTEGKKTAFLHEIQSDWEKAGRAKGYAGEKFNLKKRDELQFKWESFVTDGKSETVEAQRVLKELQLENDKQWGGTIPDMPFKKDALDLGLKRWLWDAAHSDVEKLAWSGAEDIKHRWPTEKVSRWAPEEYGFVTEEGRGKFLANIERDIAQEQIDIEEAQGLIDIADLNEPSKGIKGTIERSRKRIHLGIEEIKKLQQQRRLADIPGGKIGTRLEKLTGQVGVKQKVGKGEVAKEASTLRTKSWLEGQISLVEGELQRNEAYKLVSPERYQVRKATFEGMLKRYQEELQGILHGHPTNIMDFPQRLKDAIKAKGFKTSRKALDAIYRQGAMA